MKTNTRRLPAGLLGALLTLTASAVLAEEKVADADVIATVNGKAITITDRSIISKQLLARGQQSDDARITEELVNLELMKQEAVKRGLDKDPEIIAQKELLNTRIMANAAINALNNEIKITDEEVQQEYEQQVAKLDAKEFKASHILLDDEAAAKAVIEELNGGADFAELAKTKSTGPSGPQGGDLGWFTAQSMVPEFSAAVEKMQAGEISKEPVKTQFGYHVIKLMETRDAKKPELDKVRQEIVGILTQNKLAAKIDELRAAANIEIKEPAAQ